MTAPAAPRPAPAREMPLTMPAQLFWRLPLIRHIRWIACCWRVGRWYGVWRTLGYYENNSFDRQVLDQIWRGIV
jgi:hypothetical protein